MGSLDLGCLKICILGPILFVYVQVLLDIVKKVGASKVYCQSEATYEEAQIEKRVAAALRTEGTQLKTSWSSTLFDIDALPFKLADLPSTHGAVNSNPSGPLVLRCHFSVSEAEEA